MFGFLGSLLVYSFTMPSSTCAVFFLDCVSSQRSTSVNIDNHPESVVRVEASNVHALFNFLLTSKTTITTTGAHAGIPPTLVAPVAYEGSTLKSLTVCYCVLFLLSCVKVYRGSRYCISSIRRHPQILAVASD